MLTDDEQQIAIAAFEKWTTGDQAGAVDLLKPYADEPRDWALALIAWFLHQLGEPRWREAVPYALAAVDRGMTWAANYVLGNMLNDPTLRQQVPQLFESALAAGWQIDPIAHAMQPFQQGDRAVAAQMVGLTGPWPYPAGWHDFISQAKGQLAQIRAASGDVQTKRDEAMAAIDEVRAGAENTGAELQTRADTLKTLMDQLANAEAQKFFDEEAKTNQGEAKSLWVWGVRVLIGAAALAVLPLVIYYVGKIFGHDTFAKDNLVAAHVAPAAAFGAVAGVLLARARGRERVGQRARDLSVALGTMFVYSSQIAQEEERQRFLHDMGRVVIEAFLRQDSPPASADATSLLSAITTRT